MILAKKILLFCFSLPFVLFAQRSDDHKLLLNDLYPGEAVNTFDLRERKQVHQSFFKEDWLFGHFIFEDDRLSQGSYMLKYDILNAELNVNIHSSAFVVPMETIDGFLLKEIIDDRLFEYKFKLFEVDNKNEGKEILEYLVDGAYALLKLHYAEKLPSNYVPALDAGSLDQKVVQKKHYYLRDRNRLIELPNSKKKTQKIFEKYPAIRKHLTTAKVNFKSEEDLKSLVNLMNQSYTKNIKL